MNNSETQFSIKAVKVEKVICVLRGIIGQLFFFFQALGVNHMVRRVLDALQREPQYFS